MQPPVGLGERLGVDLQHRTIVGEEAVDLDLDIGRLGVNGRRKPFADEGMEAPDQADVGRGEPSRSSKER